MFVGAISIGLVVAVPLYIASLGGEIEGPSGYTSAIQAIWDTSVDGMQLVMIGGGVVVGTPFLPFSYLASENRCEPYFEYEFPFETERADSVSEVPRSERGWLGLKVGRAGVYIHDPALRDFVRGVRVARVSEDGPAAEAGLEPGDQIVAINGVALTGSASFHAVLVALKPGDRLQIRALRDGSAFDVEVEFEKWPGEDR